MELPSFDDCPLEMIVAHGLPKGASIIKEGVELSSAMVHGHDLSPGTSVTVLDVLPLGDGAMKRAKVSVNGGPAKNKQGWMTMVSKLEVMFLEYPKRGVSAYASSLPEEALTAARAAFSVFDADGSGTLSVQELRVVLTRPGSDGATGLNDEEVQAIIDTFDADGNGELDFAEFAVMWAPYLDPGSPRGADQEADSPCDSPGTAASFAREPLAASAGKAPKPISRGKSGKSGKGVRINGVPSQRDVTKPALQREQSSMSSRLSVLVSTSFAKKVKQTKQTFSFRRRANHALFGPRKSADQAGGSAATAKNAPGSSSVLGMAGALDSQPRPSALTSAPAAAAVADPFLSALEHAEQRDLDTHRRLEGMSARTKLEATSITTSSSEEAPAVASGSRGPTTKSTRSNGNLAGRGGSS